MIRITFTGRYSEMLREFLEPDPERRARVDDAVRLLSKHPRDTRLNLHPLKRRLKGKWSLHINGDEIIVFEWKGGRRIRFLAIGGHKAVYGRSKKKKT